MTNDITGFLKTVDHLGSKIPRHLQKELIEYVEELRAALDDDELDLFRRNIQQDIVFSYDWQSVTILLFLQHLVSGNFGFAADLFAILATAAQDGDYDIFKHVRNTLGVFTS